MAILFKTCPKCGSSAFVYEETKQYRQNSRDPHQFFAKPYKKRVKCADCGEVIFELGDHDKIIEEKS